jgi:chromosomal replication initiation ATPase DnaA
MRINPNDRIKYFNQVKFNNLSNNVTETVEQLTFTRLCAKVSEVTGVDIDKIHSKNKKNDIVKARQICHYMASLFVTKNKTEIGMHIGEKDHATVINSIKKIQNIIDVQYPLNTYNDIKNIYNYLIDKTGQEQELKII